ncbi:MAG: PQQ-dependent sugar dehydrogenase, partial [Ignavibacteria bacterium]|nr:PQQ-dependent sugar dehydrogenase [Ignavibacteria bacterium]
MLRTLPIVLLALLIAVPGCSETRRTLVATFSGSYDEEQEAPLPPPVFDGRDSTRKRIDVHLTPVARGLSRPTDIQFDPSQPELMIVTEQAGSIKWFNLRDGTAGRLHEYNVLTVSEQGLLGLAFHPAFPDSPLVYFNMSVSVDDRDISRVLEVRFSPPFDLREPAIHRERVVLDLEQPYQNHNAGQLAFGPDGFLYIGWGDGGWAGDPHDHSQNPGNMLGSMLRIDVRPEGDRPYRIPPDNPFLD